MQTHKLPGKFKRKPLSLALISLGTALYFSSPVHAQTEEIIQEEVVISGTRIRARDGMSTPTPVTTIGKENLDAMAPGSLMDGLGQLPQFYSNETVNSNQSRGIWYERGSFGSLNLRGLGINRTLTLMNGRRVISSSAFGGVDVNNFPEAMVKTVETVTGGASAAYGTDAVAGVVNFILDTKFEGFEAKLQAGETDRSDGGNSEISVAFGTDIGDKAHIQFSYEIASQDAIQTYAGRDWYQSWGTVPNADGLLEVHPYVVSASSTYNGLIFAPGTPLQGMQFSRDGQSISPYILSSVATPSPVGVPPSRHSILNGGSGDDFNSQNANLMPEFDRDAFFVYADYAFSENFTAYVQALRASNETWQYNQPGGSFHGTPTTLTIFQDNAYLPDSVRQTMIDNDIDSFTFRRMGSMSDILGESYLATESELQSITAGFNLDIDNGAFEGWTLSGYYQSGENERQLKQHGLRVDRIFAAIDAVDNGSGEIVCRTSLFDPNAFPGCEPINLFGQGNASAAAVDYVTGFEAGEQINTPLYFADSGFDLGRNYSYTTSREKINIATINQDVFEISASGEISEGFGAGPIDLAVGYSNRKEEIFQVAQDVTNPASNHGSPGGFTPVSCNDDDIGLRGVNPPDCANTVGVQYSKISNIDGEITVDELFVETQIPLLSEVAGAESLSTNIAARWADYSGSGDVWAWKGGLDWQINSQFRARSTLSRDVRAANLSERFDQTGGSASIFDPVQSAEYNVTIYSGGNPEVAPEEADTFTAGVVFQPDAIEGLSMSLDWYEVEIDGAIGSLTPQGVVNACQAGDASACARITRDAGTNNIILVGDQFVNIDQEVASGIDLEVSYSTDVEWFGGGDEYFSIRSFISHLRERSETSGDAPTIDRAGQTGIESSTFQAYALPDYKFTTQLNYQYGNFDVFLQGRYISSGTNENSPGAGFEMVDSSVDTAFYTDLNLSYSREVGGANWQVFANIANLLDEDPPVSAAYDVFLARTAQANTTLFDVLGRRFTLGIRVKM